LHVAGQAIGVFEGLGDDAGLSRGWRRIAHAQTVTGRYGMAADAAEQALRYARSSGERFEEARIVDILCASLLYGPAPADTAIARCELMLSDAESGGVMEANIAASLVGLFGMRSSFDAARELAHRAESIYAELGLQLASAGLSQVVGPMELLAGDPVAAERELRRGLAILEPSGAHGYQEALLAQVLYEQGRPQEAAQHIEAVSENAAPDNVAAQVLWRGVRAKLDAEDVAGERARSRRRGGHTRRGDRVAQPARRRAQRPRRGAPGRRQRGRGRGCTAGARALRAQGQRPSGAPSRRRALNRALGAGEEPRYRPATDRVNGGGHMPKSMKVKVSAARTGVPQAHSGGWDAALDKALAQASRGLGTGKYRINVEYWADVEVTNPGQIFAYGVTLTRQD